MLQTQGDRTIRVVVGKGPAAAGPASANGEVGLGTDSEPGSGPRAWALGPGPSKENSTLSGQTRGPADELEAAKPQKARTVRSSEAPVELQQPANGSGNAQRAGMPPQRGSAGTMIGRSSS